VAGGFGLGLALQLLQIPFAALMVGWVLIGVTQLLYMVPAAALARNGGYKNRFKGLIIAGCLVALLNALCFGLLSGI
jgi:hypothetical protein